MESSVEDKGRTVGDGSSYSSTRVAAERRQDLPQEAGDPLRGLRPCQVLQWPLAQVCRLWHACDNHPYWHCSLGKGGTRMCLAATKP